MCPACRRALVVARSRFQKRATSFDPYALQYHFSSIWSRCSVFHRLPPQTARSCSSSNAEHRSRKVRIPVHRKCGRTHFSRAPKKIGPPYRERYLDATIIAKPGLLDPESTDPKLTRPSRRGNLAQNLARHGNPGFALMASRMCYSSPASS